MKRYSFPRRNILGGGQAVPRNLTNNLVPHTPPASLPFVDAVLTTDSSLQAPGGIPLYFGSQSILNKSIDDSTTSMSTPVICATFPT
jgi:hypothetical protein